MENGLLLQQALVLPSGLWWYPHGARLTFLREETEVNVYHLWVARARVSRDWQKGQSPAFSHTF